MRRRSAEPSFHVVHCISRSSLGGGPSVVFLLAKSLAKWFPEIRQSVVLPPGGPFVGKFRSLNIPVVEIPFDHLTWSAVPSTKNCLKELQPDILHSHGKGAGLYVRLPFITYGPAIRVHSYHGFHLPENALVRWGYRTSEFRLSRQTDAIVVSSESELDDTARSLPGERSKIHLIPHVVDVRELQSRSKEPLPHAIEEFLKRHRTHHVVGMVARNDPVKNHPLALQTAAEALGQSDRLAFVFIGIDETFPGVKSLQTKFPGRVLAVSSMENTAPLLRRIHCLLLTSRKESSSIISMEAYAFGKPVVATNVEGLRDVVQHGKTGLLSMETPADLSAALLRLVVEPKLYRGLSRHALATATAMNLRSWATSYVMLYRSCRRNA
ncbi:MAG: glycosyltransferase family 4 protein [Bacteroidota bacterium]